MSNIDMLLKMSGLNNVVKYSTVIAQTVHMNNKTNELAERRPPPVYKNGKQR